MSKKVTVTKVYIDGLKNDLAAVRSDLRICEEDRDVFRREFASIYRDFTRILGEGKAINSLWAVEQDRKEIILENNQELNVILQGKGER